MPDLNETVLPVVWSVIRRALAERSLPRNELIAQLTPTGLIERKDETQSRHVRPSLAELERLELVVADENGHLRLAEPALDDEGFRFAVASRLLDVPLDADLWEERGERSLEHHLQVAVAWLCLQGVDASLTGWRAAEERLGAQLSAGRRLLRDVAPYNTLERNVRWLGVAADVGNALIPDPTELVRVALNEWLPASSQRPLREIVDAAAVTFPWMPHGRVGRGVAEGLSSPPPDDSAERGYCPECLSVALLRLEADATLEFVRGDDPNERVALSLPGGEDRAIARVVRR